MYNVENLIFFESAAGMLNSLFQIEPTVLETTSPRRRLCFRAAAEFKRNVEVTALTLAYHIYESVRVGACNVLARIMYTAQLSAKRYNLSTFILFVREVVGNLGYTSCISVEPFDKLVGMG